MKNALLQNNRILLFAIILVFSLTPCKVKASLFETFGWTYEQTLNQSKATSNCSSSCFITQKLIGPKAIANASANLSTIRNSFLVIEKVARKQLLAKVVLLQLPPKYILYKQFKFDVVHYFIALN